MQAAAMGQLLVLYECVAPAGSHSLHQSLSHTHSRSPLYLLLPRALSLWVGPSLSLTTRARPPH